MKRGSSSTSESEFVDEVFEPEPDPTDLHEFVGAINLSLAWDQRTRLLDAQMSLASEALHPHLRT